MLAVTFDLILVVAAWVTVLIVWQARRRFQPSSIWEKLMVGSSLVAFALLVRLADAVWAQLPWPALSDPQVQQAAVLIGLIGGALSVVAGLVEWLPIQVERSVRAQWRELWAAAHQAFENLLEQVKTQPEKPKPPSSTNAEEKTRAGSALSNSL